MAVRGIWVPVYPGMQNFGATIVQGASGAARQGAQAMTREFESGGRRAGEAAGRATADGLRSQQAAIQKVSGQLAAARNAEADATGKIRVAEAQLQELRNSANATAVQVARAEAALATAKEQQVQATASVVRADGDLTRMRAGEAGTANTVIRAEEGLSKARIDQARADGAVRTAEAQLNTVRGSSSATAAQTAQAEERLETARRRAQGASDRVRTSELLVRSARADAAAAASGAAGANDRVADSARRAGAASDGANGGIGRLTGGLSGMAGRAVGAAGALAGIAGIGGILMSGFDRINTLQRADIMFRNVGLSAAQTKQQMSDLNGIVTGTSLSMADASKTAGMLLQAGVAAGKPLNDSIKALTNIQAIAGGSADQVGMVLMQIKAAGKLMGGDAMQLQQAGVNVYGYLAQSLGKSYADVKKMGEDGKITYEMVIDAINAKTGNLAKEMGETMPAKLSNLKTSFANFGAAIIGPFMGPATKAVSGLTDQIKKITPMVGPAIQTMAKYKDVLLGIAGAVTVFVLPALIGYIAAQAKAAATSVWTTLTRIAGAWRTMATTIRAATIAVWAQNAAWLANPITWIIVGLVALGVALWAFFTKTETGRKLWKKIWDGIKSVTAAVVNWFKDTVWPTMQAVWNGIVNVVKFAAKLVVGYVQMWISIFRTIAQVATWLWQNIFVPVFNGIWSVIKVVTIPIQIAFALLIATIRGIGNVATWLWQNAIVPAFNGIGAVVMAVWNGFLMPTFNFIKGGIDLLGQAGLWLWQNIMVPVWNGISAAASFVWNSILVPIFDGFKAAIKAVGDVANWLWHNVMEPVWNGIKSAIETVWNFLEPIFGKIGDAFTKIGDIAGKVGQGIKDAFSGVVDILKAPLHALGSFLGSIPSKVFGVKIPGISELHDWGKKLQGLRAGGTIARRDARGNITGPGTATSDSILGVNAAGVPIVRVSTEETVVNARASRDPHNAAAMAYMNAGGSVRVPGLAAGGVIGDDQTGVGTYGLPTGTNTGGFGNDDSAFPDWVRTLGTQHQVKPSTYPGHQELDRNEDGYAPNPQHLNRGIDWTGSLDAMQGFAEYLKSIAPNTPTLEQIIWRNPNTGQQIGWHGRSSDDDGSYFANDYGGHTDHVHMRASGNIPMAAPKDQGTDASPDPVTAGTQQVPSTTDQTTAQSPTSTGTSTTQLPTLGQLAGQAVTEQIDDAADFFGFKNTWLYDPNKLGIKTGKESNTATATGTTGGAEQTVTPTTTTPSTDTPAAPEPGAGLQGAEMYAFQIAKAAKDILNSQRAAVIGDMTALQESGDPLKMYANNADPESLNYPHDAVSTDGSSSGLFQQQNNGAWGTIADRMDPYKSASMFFHALQDVSGWETMDMGAAAQAVQRSAIPGAYAGHQARAEELVRNSGLFDQGGVATSLGLMAKNIVDPERVLSPRQTSAFEDMVAANFTPRVSNGSDVRVAVPTLDEDASGSGGKRGGQDGGSLIGQVNLQAVDVDDALRKLNRTLRDAAKSDSLVGGWG